MSELKISIESKSGKLPDTSTLTNKALSYIDMNSSTGAATQSIMALAQSPRDDNSVCEVILSQVKQLFTSDFFNESENSADESEEIYSKFITLFTDINRKLVAMRKHSEFISAALNVGIINKNNVYIGVSGNLNILLYRDSVLYNLHLKDDIFNSLKPNSNKNKMVMMGTTIIPQIDAFKLSLQEGDILLFISSGISENMNDKEILTSLEFSDTRESALDKIINTVLGASTGKHIALVSLSCESQTKMPSKESSGRVIAELPPEYPPGLNEGIIELKRSNDDFYNTSQPDSEQQENRPLETVKIFSEEIEEQATKNNTPLKVVLFFISLLVTVSIGLFWFYDSDMLSPSFNTNWEVRKDIKVESIHWKNKKLTFNGNVVSFKNESDSSGKLIVIPREKLYNCEICINTSEPVNFRSKVINDTLTPNEVSFEKTMIYFITNLTGTVDCIGMNSEVTNKDGKKNYETVFKINNLKGQLTLDLKSMKSLRQAEINLMPIER